MDFERLKGYLGTVVGALLVFAAALGVSPAAPSDNVRLIIQAAALVLVALYNRAKPTPR